MFAVPGWSVSSADLKSQRTVGQISKLPPKSKVDADEGDEDAGGRKKRSKKTKREKNVSVTGENVAELWEKIIEGKPGKVQPEEKRRKKKPKSSKPDKDVDNAKTLATSPTTKHTKGEKVLKRKRQDEPAIAPTNTTSPAMPQTSTLKTEPTNLTPLQASMRQKLISARFRHLNQTLYTTPSEHSSQLFKDNPEMFTEYHEGFRRQVAVWPENPVIGYINEIKSRGKRNKKPIKGNPGGGDNSTNPFAPPPLPRTGGTCVIADLGCGEAQLAQTLRLSSKKLKLHLLSYDLQSTHPLVERADIANLPLSDNSVDVAIFCLALMGTNWLDFIDEAFRVLRWKGELWIAEIKSRFARPGAKKKNFPGPGGSKSIKGKKGPGIQGDGDGEGELALLEEEEEGSTAQQGTDVAPFIEVLGAHGFRLQTPDTSVDTSNKMFVKLNFVKAVKPTKGKSAPPAPTVQERQMPRFIDRRRAGQEEGEGFDEGKVLKPCVYKVR
ncbi:MAG: hypothetical protein M1825_003647 [Sarcosagium campestre]|nr:MAG: hypothetical protein M1825_003647 [Sarcosagium campestre]